MDREAQEAKMAAEKAAEEAEAKRQMEAEARRVEAEEARKKRAEEARIQAERDAKLKAEADAKMKAEEEAKMKAEEAAKAAAARRAAAESDARASFSRALTGIKFNSSQSTFKNESYAIMDDVAATLAKYPEIDVRIAGHTDSQGPEETNQKLSESRARAVMDYLISKGTSPQRLSAVGFGEVSPIADNNTAAGRAENRRVEFSIRNSSGQSSSVPTGGSASAAPVKTEMEKKTGEVFSRALRGIQFTSSQSTFKQESYAIMDEVVSVMSQFPEINVRIAGHTDSQGADDNNQRLSEKRAIAVMNYLVSKGVNPVRLSAVGFGEVSPVADNNTAAGRAENRRVEFTVRN